MRIIDYFDPRTELNTWENFKELNWKQKGITLLVSAIAAVIFPIYGGFVAFRALTHHFHKVDASSEKPVPSPIPQRSPPSSSASTELRSAPPKREMPEWKQMLYRGLSKQLAARNLTHGKAEENGDCLFDAVSQQLAKVGIHRTKKQVREDIQDHLETCDDDTRYRALLRGNFEAAYEDFVDRIGLCVEDVTEGAPIWGNKACLHMIADIYHVRIESYSVMAFEITLIDALNDQWDGFEKYQYHRGEFDTGYEVCSEIDESEILPADGIVERTIQLGNLSRGPWGHFVPVSPLR